MSHVNMYTQTYRSVQIPESTHPGSLAPPELLVRYCYSTRTDRQQYPDYMGRGGGDFYIVHVEENKWHIAKFYAAVGNSQTQHAGATAYLVLPSS